MNIFPDKKTGQWVYIYYQTPPMMFAAVVDYEKKLCGDDDGNGETSFI